jgi:hypothetical protein
LEPLALAGLDDLVNRYVSQSVAASDPPGLCVDAWDAIRAAASVPVEMFVAFVVSVVAEAASPETFAAETSAYVWSPRRNVDELAVPLPSLAVAIVPDAMSPAAWEWLLDAAPMLEGVIASLPLVPWEAAWADGVNDAGTLFRSV